MQVLLSFLIFCYFPPFSSRKYVLLGPTDSDGSGRTYIVLVHNYNGGLFLNSELLSSLSYVISNLLIRFGILMTPTSVLKSTVNDSSWWLFRTEITYSRIRAHNSVFNKRLWAPLTQIGLSWQVLQKVWATTKFGYYSFRHCLLLYLRHNLFVGLLSYLTYRKSNSWELVALWPQ